MFDRLRTKDIVRALEGLSLMVESGRPVVQSRPLRRKWSPLRRSLYRIFLGSCAHPNYRQEGKMEETQEHPDPLQGRWDEEYFHQTMSLVNARVISQHEARRRLGLPDLASLENELLAPRH